ncbi:MAG TPA: LssY C-terminal domain-containing protein [Terriglobales bacterium]|nr:LssY C-terminal domain-containing protein [Terriglobales bacterium]
MANAHYKSLTVGLVLFVLFGFALAQEQQGPPGNSGSQGNAQEPSAPQIRLGLGSLKPSAKPATQEPSSTAAAAPTESASGTRLLNYRVMVLGSQQWTDTKIDLVPGDKVEFAGSGQLSLLGHNCSPEGLARGWADLISSLPVNGVGKCALIGRIGDPDHAVAFAIGAKKELEVRRAGRLYLGVNQTTSEASDGQYQVSVNIVPSTATTAKSETSAVLPAAAMKFDTAIFEKIPRRVVDLQGNQGDAVNFLIVGPKEQLEAAFRDAGWVIADKNIKDAVMNATMKSTSKQVYLEMPMSELYMFNRPQDYGYVRAETIQVVASRNHLRIWKSPYEVDGQPLWVGACTHDIGFERDQRNNGVTHKIDPDIDKERDFLAGTLNASGLITQSEYVTPPNPITEAHTATGGTFRSDGRILVLKLASQ